jgi:hypothetical protein
MVRSKQESPFRMNNIKTLSGEVKTASAVFHLFIAFQLSFDCVDKHIA